MMDFEKIKYCKCKNCNKYGIPAFRKIGYRSNPDVRCKHCGKLFEINFFLAFIIKIGVPIFWGVIGNLFITYMYDIPWWIFAIPTIPTLYILEYFAPLEEKNK